MNNPELSSLGAPLLRTVVVDDEEPARAKLNILLGQESDIKIVAECETGAAAIAALKEAKPDLLLLDIQLPDMDGFSVLKALTPEQMPIVIFTTAYDQYAIKAFDAHALDYLLKPFDQERLRDALHRARLAARTHSDRVLTDRLLNILQVARAAPQARRLLVRAGGRVVFLAYDEIEWIEAAANYVRVHAGKVSYMLRSSIGTIAEKLPNDQFVRIHRSTVVNARIIKELQPCNSGEFIVVLRNGKELSCSRGYRSGLRRLIDSTPVL
ncbi:MAG TPA: LytTR family DNA-binding domain-containing protein [Terriglobales bacterium]|nr:LytTR family DNA-binding domain-containing protein [Terriglobales bacterium]